MSAEAGDDRGARKSPNIDWTAAAEAYANPPENVRYEVAYEIDGEVRKEILTAWMYNVGLGHDALVTFWDQQRPIASFHPRYVRHIRIVSEDESN